MSLSFDPPALYLITPGQGTAENFDNYLRRILETVTMAVQENVQLVQIREKRVDTRRLFTLVSSAKAIACGSRTRILVNDRADVAAAAGADGVHLTSRSMTANVIKKFFPTLIVGVSTHTPDEVQAAKRGGADFAVFGPVFETPGKSGRTGIGSLETVCRTAGEFPVLGIGGIDEINAGEVLDAGAVGFAGIRALNDPKRLRAIKASLR